jgi:N-acetylglucosamine-6-phosphate deacetylase
MTQVVPRARLSMQPPLHLTTGTTMLLTNVRLPGYSGLKRLWVTPQGTVQSVQAMDQSFEQVPPEDLKVLNLQEDWLSLGGVDLQINGALGLAFPDLTLEHLDKLDRICQYLWDQGVDSFLPTLVTSSIPQLHRAMGAIAAYLERPTHPRSARILGVHLEGPCLNPSKRGAHPEEHLQPLTLATMERILGDFSSIVKVVTLAPELDSSGEVVAYLKSLDITVSLGHSQATALEAVVAFESGATLVTHAFNAMPPLHHREPGLLGAALLEPGVRCGVIADGQHISPMMLSLLLRAGRGTEHLFLVSDALSPLGLPDGTYPWDTREITVTNGTARLPDGTLSGTTLSLLTGVQNLVRWNLCSVDDAITLGTTAPRLALGCAIDEMPRDRLYAGRPVNQLLRWHHDPKTQNLNWKRLVHDLNPVA